MKAEDVLFEKLNEKCLGCVHKCKQSSIAIIVKCPQFEKIETKKTPKKRGRKAK